MRKHTDRPPPFSPQGQLHDLAKSRFLANVSHELRTPLNAIMGFMDLLVETELDARQRHYVELSKEAAVTLLSLVEDLLDAGRIEAGYLPLKPHPFSLRQLITSVVAMYQPLADQKGLFLHSHIDSEVSEWWFGDGGRIRQVFTNLVHNALKFTPQGGVDILISLAPRGGFCFEVRDTGIGVRAEDRERIFEPFTQVDDSASRQFGGTGLGLSISKQLVHLMGGEIGVTSRPGQGSVFRGVLPLQEVVAEGDGEKGEPQETDMGLLSGKVLVVEDNRLNQALLSEMLKRLGCEVEVVGNGRESLERWEENSYDLILMDCQLPGMDGYQVVNHMRAKESPRGRRPVPIVALTADASKGVQERCREAGMVACLHKPVTIEDLYACLKIWLGKAPPNIHDKSVVERRQNPAILNLSAWRQIEKLSAEQDGLLLQRVLKLYREEGAQRLTTIGQALAAGDRAAIARAVHGFRSSCVHVGAEDLAQGLALLEQSPEKANKLVLAALWAGYRCVCCLLGAEIR